MGKDAVQIPDELRPVLARMAAELSEQIFPDGMPWGTRFDYLETLAGALGDEISRQMIEDNVSRQATASPETARVCPSCGHSGRGAPNEPRQLDTSQGNVNWVEPGQYCPHCRRAFFPSEPSLGAGPDRC